jgi:hypothetical protein
LHNIIHGEPNTMMQPELMHIIVSDMQADRRLEAIEPLVPTFSELGRRARTRMGRALVRIGYMLGGRDLQIVPRRELNLRQPA